jgi:hypothetical protein
MLQRRQLLLQFQLLLLQFFGLASCIEALRTFLCFSGADDFRLLVQQVIDSTEFSHVVGTRGLISSICRRVHRVYSLAALQST